MIINLVIPKSAYVFMKIKLGAFFLHLKHIFTNNTFIDVYCIHVLRYMILNVGNRTSEYFSPSPKRKIRYNNVCLNKYPSMT